jgi:hypothetical protein
MNSYISVIMQKPQEELGFFWSKKDRVPAGFFKRSAYGIGSLGITIATTYYIAWPKTKQLMNKLQGK